MRIGFLFGSLSDLNNIRLHISLYALTIGVDRVAATSAVAFGIVAAVAEPYRDGDARLERAHVVEVAAWNEEAIPLEHQVVLAEDARKFGMHM